MTSSAVVEEQVFGSEDLLEVVLNLWVTKGTQQKNGLVKGKVDHCTCGPRLGWPIATSPNFRSYFVASVRGAFEGFELNIHQKALLWRHGMQYIYIWIFLFVDSALLKQY